MVRGIYRFLPIELHAYLHVLYVTNVGLSTLSVCQVDEFAVGNDVRVCDNVATVQKLQKDHGEWTETMKHVRPVYHITACLYADIQYMPA